MRNRRQAGSLRSADAMSAGGRRERGGISTAFAIVGAAFQRKDAAQSAALMLSTLAASIGLTRYPSRSSRSIRPGGSGRCESAMTTSGIPSSRARRRSFVPKPRPFEKRYVRREGFKCMHPTRRRTRTVPGWQASCEICAGRGRPQLTRTCKQDAHPRVPPGANAYLALACLTVRLDARASHMRQIRTCRDDQRKARLDIIGRYGPPAI